MNTTATILIGNNSGIYSFEMIAASGDVLLRSDTFRSEWSCRETIALFQKPAHSLTFLTNIICQTSNTPLAISDSYWSISSRDYAMKVVMPECPDAKIKLTGDD